MEEIELRLVKPLIVVKDRPNSLGGRSCGIHKRVVFGMIRFLASTANRASDARKQTAGDTPGSCLRGMLLKPNVGARLAPDKLFEAIF